MPNDKGQLATERQGRTNRLATAQERSEGQARVREAVASGPHLMLASGYGIEVRVLAATVDDGDIHLTIVATGALQLPNLKAVAKGETVGVRIPAKITEVSGD